MAYYSPRGFSTLEMLIAMTLLVLTFSAVLLLVPTTQSGAIDTELGALALEHASTELAHERAFANDDFKLVIASSTTTAIEGIPFHTEITIEPSGFFEERVNVAVSWGEHGQGVSLRTLFTDFARMAGGDTCHANLAHAWSFPLATHILFGDLTGDSASEYPLTDIDVFRGRAYATVNLNVNPLPSVGAKDPGAAIDATSGGTVPFTNASAVRVSGATYATALLGPLDTTDYLIASDFGFSIPAGATIIGISADVERKSSSNTNTVKDDEVRLVRTDGSLGASNHAWTSTNWPTSESYRTYGSSNDLWNESDLSPNAVNDSHFGIAFSARAAAGTGARTASVDHIRMTITYTKQFYVVRVTGTPALLYGLGENPVATGMNAVIVATSTSIGDHAYVAMNSGTVQLEVIDVSHAPSVVATYHVPGATVAANTIAYENGYVYLGLANDPAGAEFAIIDVHQPAAPALVGQYEIGAGVNAIALRHGRAYLATDASARELVVLDRTDLAHPQLLAAYDAPGSVGSGQGRALYVVGDTLYFGRYYSLTSAPEFMVLDTTNAPVPVGTYDIGPAATQPFGIYGLIARSHLAFVLTSSNAQGGKLQILDLTDRAHPLPGASVALPHGGGGVALDCEGDTMYAASVPTSGTYAGKGSLSFITSL